VRERSLFRKIFLYTYPASHGRSWHIWWGGRFAIHVLFGQPGIDVRFRRYRRGA